MTFRMPAEWAMHERVWIGFPSFWGHWGEPFFEAQRQIAAFANAVHDGGRGETVHVIAGNADAANVARELVEPGVVVAECKIGDIWLRDTGCIIVREGSKRTALNFGFNGWGNRFNFGGDHDIGIALAKAAGLPTRQRDWILEGGSVDVDGEGLGVTTAMCLLNPNRNALLSKTKIEARLRDDLGIERLLWLCDGLVNDHTDGHVDNLMRFVEPNHLVVPDARDSTDPNARVFAAARAKAEDFGCKVTLLPSVGRIEQFGQATPASYMNFYIGNTVVVVPTYGGQYEDEALGKIGQLFPERKIVGLPASALLTGGGSFHCSSQQVPSLCA